MSTGAVNRWRESVQSVCAIAVLLALFWLCNPRLLKSGSGDGGVMSLFALSAASDGESYLEDCESDEDCGDRSISRP